MKRIVYCLSVMFFFCLSACSNKNQYIEFRGVSIDDVGGAKGVRNPDRGLRLEVAIDVLLDKNNPTDDLVSQLEFFASDSITLVQTYFYLNNLIGEKLTQENFSVMQTYFDELENRGLKAVLRFAYERGFMGRETVGPTLDQAIEHLEQLQPFLEKNKHLIHVMQAGVIGAWGEWHGSVHGLDQSDEAKRAVLEKLVEVVPSARAIQVRVPEYKNIVADNFELYNRLSFHDDMIVIEPHRWDGDMHEGSDNFNQIVAEAPYLPMDGELPWGFWSIDRDPDSPDPGWIVEGTGAARRFYLQHFSSLSVMHNYLEARGREGQEDSIKYSMQVWQETIMEPYFLEQHNMPISNGYFETSQGEKVNRTVFDYVRDHLGYRIELQSLAMPYQLVRGEENTLQLFLVNRGFSTVHNEHEVYFVLLDKQGTVVEIKTEANSFLWQPHDLVDETKTVLSHKVECHYIPSKELEAGEYYIGLWIPDGSNQLRYNPQYAIQCMNGDTEWFIDADNTYGVNILTPIKLI